mgnify:CR=1 FL=1
MALETLEKIQVKKFRFKDNPSKEVVGFVAQELHKILPEAVHVGGENPETDPWTIDYWQIIPLLINSVKELNERLKSIEKSKK